MNKILILISLLTIGKQMFSQNKVAITIDDAPNITLYQNRKENAGLIWKLDSLKIPVTLFINEKLLYETNDLKKNIQLLNTWSQSAYISCGNHSFSHARYSEVEIDSFRTEVIKGEFFTRPLTEQNNKELKYFRLPYNDLGKDSIQQIQLLDFLKEQKYLVAPFTIESSDWMFNTVYEYYIEHKEYSKAEEIGKSYVNKTLEYFKFFDELSLECHGRVINQIYLCHDNAINADYLPLLLGKLKKRNKEFIGLDEALQDKLYDRRERYYKKWGISWLYRWMSSQEQRAHYMKTEPSLEDLINTYEKLIVNP